MALVEPVIVTNMETGAPKRRRRFTAVPEKLTCTLVLDADQIATLKNFVAVTLADVLPFDWIDFRSSDLATYQFAKRPSYAFMESTVDRWSVALELVTVP
jgi:hypothetical protein